MRCPFAHGGWKHIAESIQLLLPRDMHSGVHPVQSCGGSLACMVICVDVLLQLVEAALFQHIRKCIALKRRNATSRVPAILSSLRWVRSHVKVAQENAVGVLIITSVLFDGSS